MTWILFPGRCPGLWLVELSARFSVSQSFNRKNQTNKLVDIPITRFPPKIEELKTNNYQLHALLPVN